MTIRLRLILAFVLLLSGALYYLIDFVNTSVRPMYLETVEESLNDTANILAILARQDRHYRIIDSVMRNAADRELAARIYGFEKKHIELSVYATDAAGIVVYDSQNKSVGHDFSRWNDVYLTLRGKYGARSTQGKDTQSSSLYVAAPVFSGNGKIQGSLTVVKPKVNLDLLVNRSRKKMIEGLILVVLALFSFSFLVTIWVTRPIGKLTRYVRELSEKRSPGRPASRAPEMRSLALAFDRMREELEGKKYVERYVRSLTHELRSPLSGLAAALEILESDPPREERARFLKNARDEIERMQALSDHILSLASLENRAALAAPESFCLEDLLGRAAELAGIKSSGLLCQLPARENILTGYPVLLEQAFVSLFQNSIDFSPQGSRISCTIERREGRLCVELADESAGIPEYALPHIFERFYSTERPGGRRSSGLGLSFVKEVLDLHHGTIVLENRQDKSGVLAIICLPL